MKKDINFSGVTPQTWARTIIMILALVNQFLLILGKQAIPYVEEDVYTFISMIASAVSTLWVWWKNNSFSESAQVGDVVMKDLESPIEYIEKANQPDTDHHYYGVG